MAGKSKNVSGQASEIRAEKEERVAKNEEINQTKELKVAREVTKGTKLLKAIELFGNPKLKSLTLPDLQAKLTNADPQGNETKPKNKSEALLRVTALSSVQAGLSRQALAVAVGVDLCPLPNAPSTATPAAPAILTPQQPFLPSEEDIVGFRLSYGSFASSGAFELPLAPVGPDAP